jgi:hypothetical protein
MPHNKLATSLNDNDVLLGGEVDKFIGNERFRSLIVEHKEQYTASSIYDYHKAVIFLELFHQIKSLGGRFLKYVNAAWIEVTESAALDKCKRAL